MRVLITILLTCVVVMGWALATPSGMVLSHSEDDPEFSCLLAVAASPVLPETYRIREAVLNHFSASMVPYLRDIPIVKHPTTESAEANWRLDTGSRETEELWVGSEWDLTYAEGCYNSYYHSQPGWYPPEQPVFSSWFKTILLTHEYLHFSQVEGGIDPARFGIIARAWYLSGQDGTVVSNYFKTTLAFYLYSGAEYNERYGGSSLGVEEYAYIGQVLSLYPWLRFQLPPVLLSYYQGVLSPDIIGTSESYPATLAH